MDREQNPQGDGRSQARGYLLAIAVSAIGHAITFYLVFFFLPGWLKPAAAPPAYTVKIVDAIPAGDLGTHLPRLSRQHKHQPTPPPPQETPKAAAPATPEPPTDEDKNTIALNTMHQTPTPTPRV